MASAVPTLDLNGTSAAHLEELLATSAATLVCGPQPRQLDEAADQVLMPCSDGLSDALWSFETAARSVDQLYLRYRACRSVPCSGDELRYADVTGWSDDIAMTVTIDTQGNTVTLPVPDPQATWPAATSTEPPPVKRPVIDGAPPAVLDRVPYPFCGNAFRGVNEANEPVVMECFRSAVLAGRPAEMLDVFVVWGGTQILRFDGQGLITNDAEYQDGWYREAGGMILGSTPATWSFTGFVERRPIQ
jgi:hypothetical protein